MSEPWRPRRRSGLRLAFGEREELLLHDARRGWRGPCEPRVLELLRRCDGTHSVPELARLQSGLEGLSPQARVALVEALLAQLTARGALEERATQGRSPEVGYGHPAVHRVMLGDEVRTDAFRAALEQVVRPGQRVLDLGSGTGVLAVFAARAGAQEVVALERTGFAEVARELVARHGLSEQIEVISGDACDYRSQARFDVLVSEWLGHFALAEEMFPAVAEVRERCLAPGGTMIPSRVELYLAPLAAGLPDQAPAADTPAFWLSEPAGCDLAPLLELELAALDPQVALVDPARLLAPAARLWSLDCASAGAEELSFVARLEFRATRAALLAGWAGHFRAELAPGLWLETGPEHPPTHWAQHVFCHRPLPVAAGDLLELEFSAEPGRLRGAPRYRLEVRTPAGETTQRFHD